MAIILMDDREIFMLLLIVFYLVAVRTCDVHSRLTTSYDGSVCPGRQESFTCEGMGNEMSWAITLSESSEVTVFNLGPATVTSQTDIRNGITVILTFSFDQSTGNFTSTLSIVIDATFNGAAMNCRSLIEILDSLTIHIAAPPLPPLDIIGPTSQTSSINSVDVTIGWSLPTNNGGADIDNYTVSISPPTQLSATVVTSTTVTVTADYNEDYTISIVATNCAGNSTAVEYMFGVDGCLVLSNPLNGAVGPVTSRSVGATVSFQCDPGFMSTGAMVGMVTCVNSGTVRWDPDPGTFVCSPLPTTEPPATTAPPADCGNPSPPINGSIVGPITDTSEGVMIFYRCNNGLFSSGDQPSVCGSDGLWSPNPGEQMCSAEPFYCFLPDPPTNGFIVQVSNSTILFGCNDGYMPQMNVTANCIAMNQWSPDPDQLQCVLIVTTDSTAPPFSIAPLSTGAAVGVTAIVTFFVTAITAFLAGVLVTYLMMRKRVTFDTSVVSTNPPPQEQPPPPGPVYEEVSTPKENIELETNLAYGPVRH